MISARCFTLPLPLEQTSAHATMLRICAVDVQVLVRKHCIQAHLHCWSASDASLTPPCGTKILGYVVSASGIVENCDLELAQFAAAPFNCIIPTMLSMVAAGAATQLCSARPFTTCKPSRGLRAARQPICAATTTGYREQVIKRRCTWHLHYWWRSLPGVAEAQLQAISCNC